MGAGSHDDLAAGIRLARQALEAGRDDPDTLWQAAVTLSTLGGEVALAATLVDRALTLNPNAADAWSTQRLDPRYVQSARSGDRSLRSGDALEPVRSAQLLFAGGLAIAHLYARRFETAIEWADRVLHDQPRFITAIRIKVIANAHLGRLEEARAELGRVLAIHPGLTIARYRAFMDVNSAPEAVELNVTGLRLAGLPEG